MVEDGICLVKCRGAGKGVVVLRHADSRSYRSPKAVCIAGTDVHFRPATAHTLQYSYPLKLLLPANTNSGCSQWLYPITFGGGLVEADDIHLTVDVGDCTCLVILTQSSTKVFPCPSGAQTVQHFNFSVGCDALLAVLPDPVVCFRDANFRQTQHVDMSLQGNVALLDWLTAGRLSRGEVWQFKRYLSSSVVSIDNEAVYRSATCIEDSPFLSKSAAMGDYMVSGTYLVLGHMLESYSSQLLQSYGAVKAYGVKYQNDVFVSISPLAYSVAAGKIKGCIVRFSTKSTLQAFTLLQRIVQPLFGALGGNPFKDKF